MLPASRANRLCSHGRSASAIPCRSHGSSRALARSPLLFRAQKRPHAGQRDHAAGTVRIHGEAVKDRRRRERDRGPAKPGGRRPSRRQPRQMPRERAAARRDHEEQQDDAAVSAERKRRRDERGESRGMNGVDLAVHAAADVVGRERTGIVRLIVASPVVVLDLQIAIEQQALRDDEVVRLVATRHRRRDLPRGKGKDAEGEHSRRKAGSLRARARRRQAGDAPLAEGGSR